MVVNFSSRHMFTTNQNPPKPQLGTRNTTKVNLPQKLLDIPPVLSVSCEYETHINRHK